MTSRVRAVPPAADPATFVFAHGAGAPSSSPWMKRYKRALEKRGVRVVTFDFPKTRSNTDVLERAFVEVIEKTKQTVAIGGKSMGGRIASMIAAKYTLPVSRLVFFGYPLHPPGKPEKRRDAHLPDVKQPMLFVQGARDPFGGEDELRPLAKKLGAKLLVVAGGDHSLVVPKKWPETQDEVDAGVWDAAAAFILGRQSK